MFCVVPYARLLLCGGWAPGCSTWLVPCLEGGETLTSMAVEPFRLVAEPCTRLQHLSC